MLRTVTSFGSDLAEDQMIVSKDEEAEEEK